MSDLPLGLNTGFIEKAPSVTDFIFGSTSTIPYTELNSSGDWTAYLPEVEKQSSQVLETFACVTFSALNVIETQLNYLLDNALLPATHRIFLQSEGYIVNSKLNFSDRFIAKLSGTTKQGNYLQAVADTIRHCGLVPEIDWAWTNPNFTWDEYYAEIPDSVKQKGLRFLEYFDTAYEFVADSDYPLHLKQAPLQIATAVCAGWSTDNPIKTCGDPVQHATTMRGFTDHALIFDHYVPFLKEFAPDYVIPWKFKYVITPKTKKTMKLVILDKEQYLRDDKGQDTHIYNVETLQTLFDMGLIDSPTPEPVTAINDSGKELVVLTRE